MKKIILALSTLTVLLLSSCGEDFITVKHNASEPLEDYLRNEERMYQSLIAAYDPLQWFDYFYQYDALNMVSDIMADDIYCGGSNAGDQPVLVKTHFYTATATDCCNTIWTIAYSGINRACVVLEHVDNVPDMSEETKNLYKAEATVLKAFYYTWLWKFWGNVPYYDVNLGAPYTAEQLDHDTVYNNIVTKIEEAIAMNVLPKKAGAGMEGRVTLAMAYMLYAEVVMYQNDTERYRQAYDYMKEIIGWGEYSLVADFAGLWEEAGEWGPENIWDINYISEGSVRSWDAPIATGGSVYPVLIGIPGGSDEYIDGWGFGPVSPKAYAMYDDTDIRRDGGIIDFEKYAAEHGIDYKHDGSGSYASRWQFEGYFLKKYIARKDGNHGFLGEPNMAHGNNIRIYRYAETLLNAAELAVLLGEDGSMYLNEVRARAKSQDTGTDRDAIIEERHKEFVGEGKRYWDLVRTGKAAQVLTAANRGITKYTNDYADWSESKKYWPIPQSEIDKDPALKQNNY